MPSVSLFSWFGHRKWCMYIVQFHIHIKFQHICTQINLIKKAVIPSGHDDTMCWLLDLSGSFTKKFLVKFETFFFFDTLKVAITWTFKIVIFQWQLCGSLHRVNKFKTIICEARRSMKNGKEIACLSVACKWPIA